ncbi:hypothetical protein M4951_06090 [Blastopirellula sp. J2-11]|uniref:hypothetical protein n=1 Tax=Blastopirellula sp. J2-11 TaxID=2943192 RepID=UPI0021C7BBB7|nr:hypothetical protein [Blastopirellula sp. J2-11]UUO07881.1 hypothetical protein M4951_06090 [Blastopirellula sp. J2-11]
MLDHRHLATIRAALRYWREEMTPHGTSATTAYFGADDAASLDAVEIAELIRDLETLQIGYLVLDGDTQTVVRNQIQAAPPPIVGSPLTSKIAVVLY